MSCGKDWYESKEYYKRDMALAKHQWWSDRNFYIKEYREGFPISEVVKTFGFAEGSPPFNWLKRQYKNLVKELEEEEKK